MKKALLLLLPALLTLSACGSKAAEVDETKAKEIAKNIEAESANVKTYELSLYFKTASGKGEEKVEGESNITYKVNADGEFYFKTTSDSGNTELYHVLNEKYEEVYYYTAPDIEGAEVLVKKDNDIAWGIGSMGYVSMTMFFVGRLDMYLHPYPMFFGGDNPEEAEQEIEAEYDYSISYSSANDKNLTINTKQTIKEGVNTSGEKEKAVESEMNVKYDNLHLVEYTTNSKSNFGNESKQEGKFTVLDSCQVTLPEGWEGYIQK